MICRIVFAALTLMVMFAQGPSAWAQETYQVFFLSAGSSNYFQPTRAGQHGFEKLSGANSSARLVSQILLAHGAVAGITLVSTSDRYLTRADFYGALTAVSAQIKVRHPVKPLLVVYFAGHGLSEGVAWNHFSVPGNFIYGSPMERLDVEELAKHTIYAGELVDALESLKIPFVLLLDTCYDGKAQSFESPVLTNQATQSLASVAAILRFQNEYHIPNPVIFSAEPGTKVPLAPDPTSPKTDSLGPIARRMYLINEEMKTADSKLLTLAGFVSRLTSAQLDSQTRPPVTHATGLDNRSVLLGQAVGNSSHGQEDRQATGTTATFCCAPESSTPPQGAAKQGHRMSGSLKFEGSAGEFISGGRKIDLTRATPWVTVTEPDAQSLEITFVGKDGWELDIAAPSHETLATKTYQRAQRYPFQEESRAGISLSGASHSCNEVDGKFTVDQLSRDANGTITNLDVSFEQRCLGSQQFLRGVVQLHAP
ncbi:hypothetical protein AYM40_20910 [Paraburkholderia phytofirmans OLGA172]|uniref:Caspase family p20 domain-containing protein n=1 Tax=Paraburkholderia phytofirmans OLGA172 TaxID=1417228 RepID=A0A160FQH3_9BURK|nr:caspase family protein [Paraburkholderia phytofirmans]ANB74914.1 hypothetical protein AYM40_20910 [Paraburkholderia phytofirmans OLGA172]